MKNEEKLRDYLRRLALELSKAEQRIRELEQKVHEPIAIVSMACRLPGDIDSPEALWQVVDEGRETIGELPDNRGWPATESIYDPNPEAIGKSYAREGFFLYDVDRFDPAFFGITEVDAVTADPQQRLVLEGAWECLERAHILPASLAGTAVGVFVGAVQHDYCGRMLPHLEALDGRIGVGNAGSVISGRVAYTFGLHGPAVTLDTACSSSLVAIHLACQALRGGECSLALAGGVCVMATPAAFIEYSRLRASAPDARCKAFADAADGAGWGEGMGLLLLERLSDAQRNGHRIHAVIRGSATNQDGRSQGISAPNGPAQARVIEQALANARLRASDVDVVEAHGTGTSLGDPIEAHALNATYGAAHSPERPLWLGSLKSNIGHTQAAAGVAGVVKMVLALQRERLPKTLHAELPSTRIQWVDSVRLLQEGRPWPAGAAPRRAGVSAFGLSGTNAHLILESAPIDAEQPATSAAPPEAAAQPWRVLPFPISAKTPAALRRQARRLFEHLSRQPNVALADVAHSLVHTRSLFEHRALLLADDRAQLLSDLERLAAGGDTEVTARGPARRPGKRVFVFPGQGAQWPGMAASLLASSAVFRGQIEACAQAFAPHTDWSLLDVLLQRPGAASLERVDVVQPALFAVMVSLAALWRSLGVEPDAVVGHSQGEIAAAFVAGALTLEDAARVVALRSRALRALAGRGGMLAVELRSAEVLERIAPYAERLSLAAINGPRSSVVSGDPEALLALHQQLTATEVMARMIRVDYASHSAQVEQIRAELRERLAALVPQRAKLPMYSSVGGAPGRVVRLDGPELDAEYWYRNLRETVCFAPAVSALAQDGHRYFLEVSPHPVLALALEQTLEGKNAAVAGSLRRDDGSQRRLLTSLAELWTQGLAFDWGALAPAGRPIELPTYAFERTRYWLEPPAPKAGPESGGPTLYRVHWSRSERSLPLTAAQRIGLLGDDPWGLAAALPNCAPFTAEGAPVQLLVAAFGDVGGPMPASAVPAAAHAALARALATLQRWLADEQLPALPLAIVTRGAIAAVPGDRVDDLTHAAIWGLVRSAQSEHPDRCLRLIDLDSAPESLAELQGALASSEPQICVRCGQLRVPRLRQAAPAQVQPSDGLAPGTVLVTGAFGELGSAFARHLVRRHGARQLLLVSRRGPAADGCAELCAELASLGARCTVRACDVSDRAALAEALRSIDPAQPLTAVFHVAGALEDGVVTALDPARLDRALAPKLDAAMHLHALTEHLPLRHFVLFSALGGLIGSPGQASYAAANTFLDALAQHRRARGLCATSLALGYFDRHGRLADADRERDLDERMARVGIHALGVEDGFALIDRALCSDDAVLAPVWFDLPKLASLGRAAWPSVLHALVPEAAGAATAPAQAASGERAELIATPPAQRQRRLADLLRSELAAVIGLRPDQSLDPLRPLQELGLDSLMSLQLRNRLVARTGLTLPATLLFDHPTPEALIELLSVRMFGAEAELATTPPRALSPSEPIAIVAISCRFPGAANDPEALWQLLVEGRDGVGPFPRDRGWDLERLYDPDPDAYGTTFIREAGFMSEPDRFDAVFFGISPREARMIDPQQRLLLEVAWEALERANIAASELQGSDTGVYIGIGASDYVRLHAADDDDGHAGLGNVSSVASGRIAYVLGLQGPALSIDTACSSSLVAVHLAVRALRAGECSLALAGGASLLATPSLLVKFSRMPGFSSPEGRCKAFGLEANGAGWGEGVGLVLLERLSDAQRNGRSVLAVVRGSAINQDGRSQGLSAPNGLAQQLVIREALSDSLLTAADVDMVEAHGTGTTLGDPIEAEALLATYGSAHSPQRPLWLGSIKSNLGHTAAAAGVAGVIKAVLALQHGVMPCTLHVARPSAYVDWSSGALRLLVESRDWSSESPRRAGVSAFGISGTNAHVILEQAPPPAASPASDARAPWPVWLSARSEGALREQAARLAAHLREHPALSVRDVAFTLATGRSQFEWRLSLVAEDLPQLIAGLTAAASGRLHAARAQERRAVACLFAGQGSQRAGAGRELYECSPVFARAFDEVVALLEQALGEPVRPVLFAQPSSELATRLDETLYTQSAVFASEVAQFRLLESWGLAPELLLGHSVGEIAAAHVAGVFSLADACLLVATRARAMQALPAGGAMLSVACDEGERDRHLLEHPNRVWLAASNAPRSFVLSGDLDAIEAIERACAQRGQRATRLRTSHAFHSPHMRPMLEELRRVARGLDLQPPRIPIVSNLTGRLATDEQLCGADYWVSLVEQPVLFCEGVRTLFARGVDCLLELGPSARLSALAHECASAGAPNAPVVVALQRKDLGEREACFAAVAKLHCEGVPLRLAGLFDDKSRLVALPTYGFQRQRYWLDPPRSSVDLRSAGMASLEHPLLAAGLELADGGGLVYASRISLGELPWLEGHRVFEHVLFPATCFVELALAAGRHLGLPEIEELSLEAPLALPFDAAVVLQVHVADGGEASDRRAFSIYSRRPDEPEGAPFFQHARGVLSSSVVLDAFDLSVWPPPGAEQLAIDDLYSDLSLHGLHYGPQFRGVRAVWRRGDELFAEVVLPAEASSAGRSYGLHPALLDATLHPLALAAPSAESGAVLPFALSGVKLPDRSDASALRVRLAPRADSNQTGVWICDAHGAALGAIDAVHVRPASPDRLRSSLHWSADTLYALRWTPLAAANRPEGAPSTLQLIGPGAAQVHAALAELQQPAEIVREWNDVDSAAPAGLIYCAQTASGEASDALAARACAATQRALAFVQHWLGDGRFAASRLTILTERALAADLNEDVHDLAAAPIVGLLRSALNEHPQRALCLIDLDGDARSLAALPSALALPEPQLALRAGEVRAARLAYAGRLPSESLELDPEGTVLITGASGGLAPQFARHLCEQYAVKHLLLSSRRGSSAPGADALRRELEAHGARVRIEACDLGSRSELDALLATIPPEQPLTAIVHCAGVVDDGVFSALSPERIVATFRAKVDAALHLHDATQQMPLRAFVLFSALSGVVGSLGQANYAAANAFLDALAHHRRARGLPATSLAWGYWADTGMAAQLASTDRERGRRYGIAALDPVRARASFDSALHSGLAALVPANFDLTAVRRRFEELPPLFRSLLRGFVRFPSAHPPAVVEASRISLAERLSLRPAEERSRALLQLVCTEVESVFGVGASALEVQRPLSELGLDSLMAVELRNRLGAATGLALPAGLLFDHPTPQAVATYLECELFAVASAEFQASDAELRSAIARIPLTRLREAGLLDVLLRLAQQPNSHESGLPAPSGIDEMDADGLVELALCDTQHL